MKNATVLLLTACLALWATASGGWIPDHFIRGDANRDGKVDLSDASAVLDHLFTGKVDLDGDCPAAADANGDDLLNVADPIFLLDHLFLGGRQPPAPFPLKGTAPEGAALGCETYEVDVNVPVFDPPSLKDLFPSPPDFFPGSWGWDGWSFHYL